MTRHALRAGAAAIALMMMPHDGANAASWIEKDAFDPVCHTDKPGLAVVLDMTSPRRGDELTTADEVKRFIHQQMAPGRQLIIYHETGDGQPVATEKLCKPVPCDNAHVLWRTFTGNDRTCTDTGYRQEQEVFSSTVEGAFARYYETSRSDHSPLFETIATVSRDLRSKSITHSQMVLLSDGLPNSPEYPYNLSADWLKNDEGKEALAADLRIRGALPSLQGHEIHFVLSGRPFATAEREKNGWIMAVEETFVAVLWAWYGGITNTTVTRSPFFDVGAITLVGETTNGG